MNVLLLSVAALVAGPVPLSSFITDPAPWTHLAPNSEQRQPLYLGATPREMVLGLPLAERPTLRGPLRGLGEAQARAIAKALGEARVELEAWPIEDDEGRHIWAFARWRRLGPGAPARGPGPWTWLDAAALEAALEGSSDPRPMLPRTFKIADAAERDLVYKDPLLLPSLYDKPWFGSCIFTAVDKTADVLSAWPALDSREAGLAAAGEGAAQLCRALTQPPRLNAIPVTFLLTVDGAAVRFPPEIAFVDDLAPAPPLDEPLHVAAWPQGFDARYRKDVEVVSGAADAWFADRSRHKGGSAPTGRSMTFLKKSSAQPDHQLEFVVDWLEERYAKLGLETRRQRFTWRGIPQSNLTAVIPGTLPPAENRPVLLVDHLDTAFAEDVFDKTGKRASAPGADDNATAVAALLGAAEVLRGQRLAHDVWLVHLTGEEFPGDDLGARHFVSSLLTERRDVGGFLLLDMIGWRLPGDPVVQVNPGPSAESGRSAQVALDAIRDTAPGLTPTLRPRHDERSYLYNTDGLIFADAGYPVVLLNEHINYVENLDRPHYHMSTDTVEHVDFPYAVQVTKAAIEAAARLARRPGAASTVPAGLPPSALPPGALHVPLIRQATGYSCGAASLLAVLYYWTGYEGKESDLYERLETTPDDGTQPPSIVKVAQALGLTAALKEGMTVDDLRLALSRGETVIIDLQAWRTDGQPVQPWRDTWEEGHYVVLVGLDADRAYVMDPVSPQAYVWLPITELVDRWHDYEDRTGTVWRYQHLGIAIHGARPNPAVRSLARME